MIPLLLVLAHPFHPQSSGGERVERVYYDTLDEHGRLTGGVVPVLVPSIRPEGSIPAPATTLTSSLLPSDPANRIDLVFVGDGYTAAQLGTYAAQVDSISLSFFNKEPYITYAPYFSVHRVDVISNQSGVDHDPTQGILRDTAMDMGYWCNDIDRLLCVSVSKAWQYANNVPSADLVAALANSSTYGGAGYPSSDLATCAAANSSSLEILRHEFGHALGNLADEYHYSDGTTYTGAEPGPRNVSKLTSAQMASAGTKWAAWLGVNNPAFDGLVSTFEGAYYNQYGVHRPTNNSIMRSLGRPFNLASAEGMIIEIYRMVRPIDASSSTSVTYTGSETLFVTPMVPVGNPLSVQWSLNGTPIPGATGTTLQLATLGLGSCPASVTVRVTDDTTLVRDEAARAQWMTETRTFVVLPGGPPVSSFCVTSPNSAGPGAVMAATGSTSIASNDLHLTAFGCPANVSGIFFFGTTAVQVPLGNGVRCAGGLLVRLPVVTTNILGDADFSLDLGALPGGATIQAGDTRYFQFWYRDTAGGGAGNNLTDGLAALFCP